MRFMAGALGLDLLITSLMLAGCTPNSIPPKTALDEQPPRMVSAFFGLDNALTARRFKGADGMPVTFSRRVKEPIEGAAFTITTRSGKRLQPEKATTRPANAADKRHTVLLIGEFGNAPDDPPIKVEVSGHLPLDGGEDAHGLSVAVTPLVNGPSLVLAYAADPEKIKGDHPADTKQIIVVVWNGGVRPVSGVTHDAHRLGYTVTTENGEVVPAAIGNLGDRDNYEHLYLDTEAKILRVSMKSGILMDPRDDPNPATSVEVAGLAVKP